MLRKKQELSKEECIEILKKEKRGVLSVLGDEGYPYGMPISLNKASYCVYGDGFIEEGNWYLCFKSVIVFGKIEFIEDPKVIEDLCRKLSYRFTDDASYIEEEIRKSLAGTLMFSLSIEHISGKYVTEK